LTTIPGRHYRGDHQGACTGSWRVQVGSPLCRLVGIDAATSFKRRQRAAGRGVLWAVKAKAKPGRPLSISQRRRNRCVGKIRAQVEHVFRMVKCQFGYRKGSLSRHRQKRRTGLRVARARKPIPCPQDTCVRLTKWPGECRPRQVQTKNPSPSANLLRLSPFVRKGDVAQRFPNFGTRLVWQTGNKLWLLAPRRP
jgi:hypothetical protein